MAIIYTYPRLSGQPDGSDLVLITDVSDDNKSKNTTIQSINDLGPQGTVTDVDLAMPAGFVVDKTITNGDISFVVTGFQSELPADDPDNSVQFNFNGALTGIDGFTFREDLPNEGNTLFLGGPITGLNKRGTINLYNQGAIGLWANTSGTRNQRVAITGPRGLVGDSPSSYSFALPGHDPILPYGSTPPNDPANENPPPSYTEPRVLVIEGAQYTTQQHDSSWFKVTDLPGLGPGKDSTPIGGQHQVQYDNGTSGFGGSQGLSIEFGTTTTRLDVGHKLNPTARGKIAIHSGQRSATPPQTIGGVIDLEYAYPTAAPASGGAAAYAFVGLMGPEYDPNLVPGDEAGTYALQNYNIQLPVVQPSDDTQTTYADSRLLVVNAATTGTGTEERFQSKWISPDDLGIGAAGQNGNVQYNFNGTLAADSAFIYRPDNAGTGVPGGSPRAHEVIIGAGGGALPGMLTLYGDNDPVNGGGVAGILKFVAPTGQDFATITGPDNQTEITATTKGTGYSATAAAIPTTYNGNGSGLEVYIEVVNEQVDAVSLAAQGSGYSDGDVLTIVGGDNNATITVVNARVGADEPQIYDLKLPTFPPNEQKIFFGTGTGKQANLTTSGFFKVREETGKVDSGLPTQGTTIQLQIGNPTSTGLIAEPYGSILLNGGDNTAEGGAVRFISGGHKTQWVNLIGPPGYSSNNLQPAPDPYSIMLPQWSPDTAETMFPDLPGGVSGLQSPPQGGFGSNYQTATKLETTTNNNGIGCRVNIVSVNQSGGISNITIDTPGHGYVVGDTITVVQSTNTTATINITAIKDVVGGKVLVAAVDNWQSQGANNNKEMHWVDPEDLGSRSAGFSPLSIYDSSGGQGAGAQESIWCQTIVENACTINKVDYLAIGGNTSGLTVALYRGELRTSAGSTAPLIGFGEISNTVQGINTVSLSDGDSGSIKIEAGDKIIVAWSKLATANGILGKGSATTPDQFSCAQIMSGVNFDSGDLTIGETVTDTQTNLGGVVGQEDIYRLAFHFYHE
jgi:hypothetical protein